MEAVKEVRTALRSGKVYTYAIKAIQSIMFYNCVRILCDQSPFDKLKEYIKTLGMGKQFEITDNIITCRRTGSKIMLYRKESSIRSGSSE